MNPPAPPPTKDPPSSSGTATTTTTTTPTNEGFGNPRFVSFPDGHALAAAGAPTHRGDDVMDDDADADELQSMAASSSDESSGLFPSRELDEMFDGEDDNHPAAAVAGSFYYGL